jgi:zinc/manganese transport system permease protein
MWEALDFSILLPAFVAGLLVLSTHVPLGQVVLKRGIIFIDLAIAQIAGLGVILAHLLLREPTAWHIQLIAAACAIGGALLLRWTEKKWLDIQEALIGVLFVLAASISILLLTGNPHAGEQLKDILSGQILWVSWQQLSFTAVLYLFILGLWFGFKTLRSGAGFYILFALSVTASVQLVGVYLVFSSLIIPALAVYNITSERRRLGYAYLCGMLAYGFGLSLSAVYDLASGPLIVIGLAISAIALRSLITNKLN